MPPDREVRDLRGRCRRTRGLRRSRACRRRRPAPFPGAPRSGRRCGRATPASLQISLFRRRP
ncbi:hypothetical protein FE256_04970 [Microbacterium sp. 5K110]|nr:hypothetical protein FE256_04970 [Microbacterium sp. 5K110]